MNFRTPKPLGGLPRPGPGPDRPGHGWAGGFTSARDPPRQCAIVHVLRRWAIAQPCGTPSRPRRILSDAIDSITPRRSCWFERCFSPPATPSARLRDLLPVSAWIHDPAVGVRRDRTNTLASINWSKSPWLDIFILSHAARTLHASLTAGCNRSGNRRPGRLRVTKAGCELAGIGPTSPGPAEAPPLPGMDEQETGQRSSHLDFVACRILMGGN